MPCTTIFRTALSIACCLSLYIPAFSAVAADNPIKSALTCAQKTAGATWDVSQDVAKKYATIAKVGGTIATCQAMGGNDQYTFPVTLGIIGGIKLASPSTLPNGQCKVRIHNLLAKPFAEGVSLVVPPSSAKTQLQKILASDETGEALWGVVSELPPPIMTYTAMVDCACTVIDDGVTLTDLSVYGAAINGVSKTCGAFLDDVGLGFINDYGNAAIEWTGQTYSDTTGWWDKNILGQAQHADPETVYKMYWAPYEIDQAAQILTKGNGAYRWHAQSNVMPDQVISAFPSWSEANNDPDPTKAVNALGCSLWGKCQNTNNASPATNQTSFFDNVKKADATCKSSLSCTTNLKQIWSQCVTYYDTHTASLDHARQWCDTMRDQRFGPASKKLAQQFGADIQTRELVQKRLDALKAELGSNWTWRLPHHPSQVKTETFSTWSDQEAANIILGFVGDAKPWIDAKYYPWKYATTGVFAAAREALLVTNWNPSKAVDLAFVDITVKLQDNLRNAWNKWGYWDGGTRLNEWLPTDPFGGKYGCPSSGVLSKACIADVEAIYKNSCAEPVRDVHLNAPHRFDLDNPGLMMKKVKESCLAKIQPRIQLSLALQDTAHDVPALSKNLCDSLPSRSDEQLDCLHQLDQIWEDCTTSTYQNNQSVGQAKACVTRLADSLRAKRGIGTRIDATPSTTIPDAPKADSSRPVLKLPSKPVPSATHPDSERPVSAPKPENKPIRIGRPC